MIAELKQNIDLVSVVEAAGIELRRSGSRMVGSCPFHDDKTPSFYIFSDNHFKCFGCQASGDVIDFVQKMYGFSFPDALKYLGIEQGRVTPKIRKDIKKRKRRAELVKEFKDWLSHYSAYVGSMINETQSLMRKGIPLEDLELYVPLLHRLPVWEYHLSILVEGSDELKCELYKDKMRPQHGKRKF